MSHGALDCLTPPGRHKLVENDNLSQYRPQKVIEGGILNKNYGSKSADRTADFDKIKFFRFFDPCDDSEFVGRHKMINLNKIDDLDQLLNQLID